MGTALQELFRLNHCLHNRPTVQLDGMHPRLLVLVEIKADQIPLVDVVIVQVVRKLLLPLRIILISPPDFKFDDILLV